MIQIHSIQNHLSLSTKSRPDLNILLKTGIFIHIVMKKIAFENTPFAKHFDMDKLFEIL